MIFRVAVILVPVSVVPLWRIFDKAGFPGALSLLQVIPLANVIVLFVVAFTEWPIERGLARLRSGR